jgi:hypothetical protein
MIGGVRKDVTNIRWRYPEATHTEHGDMLSLPWVTSREALKDWLPTAKERAIQPWLLRKIGGLQSLDHVGDMLIPHGTFLNQEGAVFRPRSLDRPCFTLMAGTGSRIRAYVNKVSYLLDERGWALLQGFPPDIGLTYHQIGNSVPPAMSTAMFMAQSWV